MAAGTVNTLQAQGIKSFLALNDKKEFFSLKQPCKSQGYN